MLSRRFLWIGVLLVFLGASNAALSHAATISVINQTYQIGGGTSNNSISQSSSTPPLSGSVAELGEQVFLIADGAVSLSSGFIFAGVDVTGGGGGVASAILDFRPSMSSWLMLTTSGAYFPGEGNGQVQLVNLTDNVSLLNYGGVPDFFLGTNILAGSFTFLIDPSKAYRLEVDAGQGGPDFADARIDFLIAAVPEPATIWLLVSSLAGCAIAQRKLSPKSQSI